MQRTITVTGHGRVSGVPDVVSVQVGATAVRPGVREATQEASGAADRVVAALRGAGVARGDLRTQHMTVVPQHDQQGRQVAYNAAVVFQATIRDVAAAGEIVASAIEAAGAAALVQGMRFAIADDAGPRAHARDEAFADARSRAERYAELAGGRLGQAIEVVDGPHAPVRHVEAQRLLRPVFSEAVEPGTQEVVASVTVVFELL